MSSFDKAFLDWIDNMIKTMHEFNVAGEYILRNVRDKFLELRESYVSNDDLLNVMGSFMETSLDCVSQQSDELNKYKSLVDDLKNLDLYYQESDYNWDEELELSYYTFDMEGFIDTHLKDNL